MGNVTAEIGRSASLDCVVTDSTTAVGSIMRVIEDDCPGKGSIPSLQILRFLRPINIGDELTTSVEVLNAEPHVIPTESLNVLACKYRLKAVVKNKKGDILIKGEVEVLK